MSTITVHVPLTVAEPRGAKLAAHVFAALLRWAQKRVDASHVRREQISRLTDAARVRRLASAMNVVDPRFAADLMAAADRHERS